MKIQNILVAANGATLNLSNGKKAIAAFPARKGDKCSFVLSEDGQLVRIKEARINGVGVKRFLTELGFVPAGEADPAALRLADLLDIQEGTELVEKASQQRALQIQREYAGKSCLFVPFDASNPERNPIRKVDVEPPRGFSTMHLDLASAFSSGSVSTAHAKTAAGLHLTSDIALCDGWLVDGDVEPATLPRNTKYGGLIELAVFVIANSGLGTLTGEMNLTMKNGAAVDDPFPRGQLDVILNNGDILHAGAEGGDQLHANYVRDGKVIYSRTGMPCPRLGEVIGAIAAVIVRVGEMDEAASKKSRKKAA